MSSGRRKLLLADDSPTIQKVISLTFGDDEGFEVVAVGDGAQALRALEDEPPPDVVLADVVMPGPDGYELCERIRRDKRLRHVPVVLLVGTFEPFNEAEARRVGADTVLTKPFQSIRDLVSKVGSLLGGGEAKPEEPADARAPRDEQAPLSARADDAGAGHGAAFDEPDEQHAENPAASFADLGADDELIEARPAEAFGASPSFSYAREEVREEEHAAAAEPPDHDLHAAPIFETNGKAAHAPAAPVVPDEGDDDFVLAVEETEDTEPVFVTQPRESVMSEPNAPRTSFEARAKDAAAADDALLDLGRAGSPASAASAEADDFILDLDFDDAPPAQASDDVFDSPFEEAPAPAPAWADAPSAFAEAAHGERPRHLAEATPASAAASFDQQSAFGEPSSSFDSSPSSAQPEASARHEEAPWRDVVVQDGPQGFAFGGEEPQAMGAAPRGFVEPEVVPADEPVPAVVEGEFTDGSVEGDLPKSPAAQTSSAEAAPQEPSTAGYAVGHARTGLDEAPRAADQLSPEAVETIARRVVELMSDKVVREIAWDVVPELAELIIRQRLEENSRQ